MWSHNSCFSLGVVLWGGLSPKAPAGNHGGDAGAATNGGGLRRPRGSRRRDSDAGAGMPGPTKNRSETPNELIRPPRGDTRAPRGAGLTRPEGAAGNRQPVATRRLERAGVERSLALVREDRRRRLDRHGGSYLHWLVTARAKFHSEH